MNLLIAFLNLRRIDVFLFIGIKAKLHKNICKRNNFFAKRVFIRPVSKENVIFSEYSTSRRLFCKKTILNIKVPVFGVRKTFFFFLKGKKDRGIYVLCFKASKILGIGQVMRVL